MVISLGKQFSQLKNYKISPNCEGVAIGIANIGSSLFNGMPVSGSLGRSSLQVGLSIEFYLISIYTCSSRLVVVQKLRLLYLVEF